MNSMPSCDDFSRATLQRLSKAEKIELLELLMEKERRKLRNKLPSYTPYPKQLEFHAAGLTSRERLLMAGNQLGKTIAGSAEMALHLTGRYEEWEDTQGMKWPGRKFDRPIRAWGGSKTNDVVRDVMQHLLVGEPKDKRLWGTGFIPGDAFDGDPSRKQGVADAVDGLMVKHISGLGSSSLGFKTYEQGREKWQGPTLDIVWFDEEPPMDIYMEGLTRTNATGGFVYMTFTPLLGMSTVVEMFLKDCGMGF